MPLLDPHRKRVREAAAARRGGDFHRAIEILADVLTADPEHVPANAEMGRALLLIGDATGAEEHLRAALNVVLDYRLVVELAAALAQRGGVAEAEQALEAALLMTDKNPRLDPGEALLVRAAIAHAQGRDDDARAALDAIVPKRATTETKTYAERLRASLEPAGRTLTPGAEGEPP